MFNTKVAPNVLSYLQNCFYIFWKLLSIFQNSFGFSVHWKMNKDFQKSFPPSRVGPVNQPDPRGHHGSRVSHLPSLPSPTRQGRHPASQILCVLPMSACSRHTTDGIPSPQVPTTLPSTARLATTLTPVHACPLRPSQPLSRRSRLSHCHPARYASGRRHAHPASSFRHALEDNHRPD
jgi:hypothetical protein